MGHDRQRLDKVLAHLGFGTRKEIKKLVRDGRVQVNGQSSLDPGQHVDPTSDVIQVDGIPVTYRRYIYVMMNKPPGVLSATRDSRAPVVVDLLSPDDQVFHPFPVGRLDKDTEGLLLLTNDGELAHRLLSPKRHVPKTYYARVAGTVTRGDVAAFAQGIRLDDGYVTMPAELSIVTSGAVSEVELTIYEGKFHQVKRMFLAVGKPVMYLKRIRMGPLVLDEALAPGEYRELTDEEVEQLRSFTPAASDA
jgi:16S rRNA pseudouridine516 synthase